MQRRLAVVALVLLTPMLLAFQCEGADRTAPAGATGQCVSSLGHDVPLGEFGTWENLSQSAGTTTWSVEGGVVGSCSRVGSTSRCCCQSVVEPDGTSRTIDPTQCRAVTSGPRARRVPGDYEALDGVVVSLSGEQNTYDLETIELIQEVSREVPVTVLLDRGDALGEATAALDAIRANGGDVTEIATTGVASNWARDFGPLTVCEGTRRRFVDAIYEATFDVGGPADRVPPLLAERGIGVAGPADVQALPLNLEGGNFLSDGDGLCISTTRVIERNPGLTTEALSQRYRDVLGCRSTVVLEPLRGTVSHVDEFVAFTGPRRALVLQLDPRQDAMNAALADRGAAALTAAGVTVTRLPGFTAYHHSTPSSTRPIGHTNVLVTPRAVYAPDYEAWFAAGILGLWRFAGRPGETRARADDLRARQAEAYAILGRAYGRPVIPSPASESVAVGKGALHCLTASIPRCR